MKLQLNVQIPLIIGVVVLITSFAICFISLQISSSNLERTILHTIEDNATSNAELLSATLNGQLDVVWELANRIRTRTMELETVRPSLVADIPRIGADSMALIYPDGTSYDIETGTVIDLSDRDYFRLAMTGQKNIAVIFSRLVNRIMVFFVSPIFESDEAGAPVIGVLFAAKEGNRAISDIIMNLKSVMPSGYSYLIDNSGTVIAHPNTEFVTRQLNPIAEAANDPSLKPVAEMMEPALRQRNGISRYTYEGRRMIGYYVEVPGYPWVLFNQIERRDIDNQLATMRIILLSISFIVSVILAGLLAFFGSRSVLLSVEERERMAHEANERRKEIEKLIHAIKSTSESRTAFLSNISNKMAVPINTIIRLSSLISRDKEISENIRKPMEGINNSGVMLFEVVYDIIDILKIETRSLRIRPVKYNLPNLIFDMTVHYLTFMETKPHVKFQLTVDETLPLRLVGDELRIRHICQHLLDNAFKITAEGVIAVNISCKRKSGYAWLIIKISDTGIGMGVDKLEELFAGYGRMDSADKANKGGTGLGLNISRQIAELMKGTLTATSEKNKGTVFVLAVPQKLLSEETIGKETAEKLMRFQYSKV